MGCEQVCLKWNNFSLNITKNIDDLWKDESLVDVSIISDGQCIQAHKVILSASSPLFKSLFAVNPCQHPVIILQDVRFRELVSIITFIYKGEVNIFEESLPALLQAAKTLQIRGLSDSVDRDSLNRLYALRDEVPVERTTKKRKTHNNNSSNSNNAGANTQMNESQSIDDDNLTGTLPDTIIPKEEPKLDNFPADFLAHVTDEEDVKTEDLVLHSDRTQDILQSADLVGSATGDDTSTVNTAAGMTTTTTASVHVFACPFCPRTYSNWGFRRRHIKTVHYITGPDGVLPCRLCPAAVSAFSLEQWIYHMLDEHQWESCKVQEDVSVYKEAIMVLQGTAATSTHAPSNVT